VGHSEGSMPRLSLLLAPAFLGAVLINPLPPRIALSQGARGWLAAIASDPAAILFLVSVVVIIAILVRAGFAAKARRRERALEAEQVSAVTVDEGAIARWVEGGQRLFGDWQERIERLDELHGRLAAMAQEIEQLKTQVSRTDAVQAENLRLVQENEALLGERDQVRAVFARIGELIRQASEARPRP
jgi:hypothetical protein